MSLHIHGGPLKTLTFKIFFLVGLVVASCTAAGYYGLQQMGASVKEYERILAEEIRNERAIQAVSLEFKTQVQEWKNTLLRGSDDEQREKYWGAFQKREAGVRNKLDVLLADLPPGETRELVQQFSSAHKMMGEGYATGFEAFVSNDFLAASGDAAVKGMDRAPAQLLKEAEKALSDRVTQSVVVATQIKEDSLNTSLSLLAVFAMLGAVSTLWLVRSVSKQLGGDPSDAVQAVRLIADGNMSVPIAVRANDKTSVLAGLESMRQSLTNVVKQVRETSDTIASSASQIASSGSDQSQRIEYLASSIEQTAAAMEELGSTVSQNAANARQADDLAKTASTVAAAGGKVVAEVVETMSEINESSQQIVDIIEVIDSIAFQTNLLALNAAVEAARAGEEGRGFAVVASEVRALAHRSATAANKIKELITASVSRVERGGVLVDKAGATMNEVVASIGMVTDLMGEISHASNEQSVAVRQVGEAVSTMERNTQQSTNLVQENGIAASKLRNQSEALVAVVSRFKLQDPSGHDEVDSRRVA